MSEQIKRQGNRVLLICLGSIILYQLVFLGFILFFHDELSYNPVTPPTYEQWTWLVEHPDAVNDGLLRTVQVVTVIMNVACLLGYLYVLSSKEFAHKMKKWQIGAAFLTAYAVHLFCNYLIRNFVAEYRMYMHLIPTEILSLLLLFFVLTAMRGNDRSGI